MTSRAAIERSQKAAQVAVTEMMETHGMLRNDTSALFERLREANVLLQEVLGGATENLAKIETTLSGRVASFVTAMNDVGQRSGAVSEQFETQMRAFLRAPARCCRASRRRRSGSTRRPRRSLPPRPASTSATNAPSR